MFWLLLLYLEAKLNCKIKELWVNEGNKFISIKKFNKKQEMNIKYSILYLHKKIILPTRNKNTYNNKKLFAY